MEEVKSSPSGRQMHIKMSDEEIGCSLKMAG